MLVGNTMTPTPLANWPLLFAHIPGSCPLPGVGPLQRPSLLLVAKRICSTLQFLVVKSAHTCPIRFDSWTSSGGVTLTQAGVLHFSLPFSSATCWCEPDFFPAWFLLWRPRFDCSLIAQLTCCCFLLNEQARVQFRTVETRFTDRRLFLTCTL